MHHYKLVKNEHRAGMKVKSSVNLPQLKWWPLQRLTTLQVDVYSFGVVLWELWTGREPYDGLNYHALLHQITTSKGLVRPPMPNSPEWEHDPLPELAPGYQALIQSCWEESPSKRFT